MILDCLRGYKGEQTKMNASTAHNNRQYLRCMDGNGKLLVIDSLKIYLLPKDFGQVYPRLLRSPVI